MKDSHSDTTPADRPAPIPLPRVHAVLGTSAVPPHPEGFRRVQFGMGCFWGAEKCFWSLAGVHVTAVGYAGGPLVNPTYEEVCSGTTDHAEVVLVVHDPAVVSLADLLTVFWESHDPTQGMRQGNDRGSQYRSAVFLDGADRLAEVKASRERYQAQLTSAGLGDITTEIGGEPEFYPAEAYHQQYLHVNPGGYCGLGGTGVDCS